MKTIDLRRFWMGEFRSLFGALFIAVFATCTLILLSVVFGIIVPAETHVSQFIAYITYDLIIALGCYFLCLKNPYSVWFVPVVCNAAGIVSAILEPDFWVSSMWILTVLGWMISLISSLWGHDIGIKIQRERI